MNDLHSIERRQHPSKCLHESDWGKVHQYIVNQEDRWTKIENIIFKHIDDGEKSGGVRDRVLILERELYAIKQGYWRIGLLCGFIGALIGQITPDAIITLVSWITK